MASLKKEKVRNPKVSVKAKAIDEGYYKNRIVRINEVFDFEGEFEKNAEGEFVLPSWMEPVNFEAFEKLSVAAKKALDPKPAKGKGTAAEIMSASAPSLV